MASATERAMEGGRRRGEPRARRVSVAREAGGAIAAMLWVGGDDPRLVESLTFETVADLRRWLVSLKNAVDVDWTPDLLNDRSLAITVGVALGVRLPVTSPEAED